MKLAEKDGKGWQACTENGQGILGQIHNMPGTMLKAYWPLLANVLLCSSFTLVVLDQETLLLVKNHSEFRVLSLRISKAFL